MRLSGPADVGLIRPSLTSESSSAGDRALVNPARLTRTRFYSARKTRQGIATLPSDDCVEMNPAAEPH
jgi:hypothetical protein